MACVGRGPAHARRRDAASRLFRPRWNSPTGRRAKLVTWVKWGALMASEEWHASPRFGADFLGRRPVWYDNGKTELTFADLSDTH